MKPSIFAGLLGVASLGAQAQAPAPAAQFLDTPVVTATRSSLPGPASLRDVVSITREELEDAGTLTLAEVLQRRAGIEYRATGGPGQPAGLFMRGTGSAQSLILIDGLRAGSATVGTTSIENIPLEMIERIEVVKGPMSSLYGSEAIGGVIQVFMRGRHVPHLFASAGIGQDKDRRLSVGLASVEQDTRIALSMGAREVDAPSATNARNAFSFNGDGDPYENAFANFSAAHRAWQGELLELSGFASRGKTRFDAGPGTDDVNEQTIAGVRFTSAMPFSADWTSRLTVGQGFDRLEVQGAFPNRFETRQDQAAWINEFATRIGSIIAGVETVRQKVHTDQQFTVFSPNKRDTDSVFVSLRESLRGQQLEASFRRDDDEQFGGRNTGSASYGLAWPSVGILSATYGEGFRAPSFYDLYGPSTEFYRPNPGLAPERSRSVEVSLRNAPGGSWQWRVTAFDNRLEDLITFVAPTVENVARASIKGVEVSVERQWLGARWRANFTGQRSRDEDTGKRLQGRAETFGTVDVSRSWGAWTAGFTVTASGDRFDSTTETESSRLGGYAVADARLKYTFAKNWTATLSAANLFDKRYETAAGYDAPRRGVFLKVTFDAF